MINRHMRFCTCGRINFCKAQPPMVAAIETNRATTRILRHTKSMARHVISAIRKAAVNPYLIKVVRKREGRWPAAAYGSPVVNDASIIGGA